MKFKVEVEETIRYQVEVEADDDRTARLEAVEAIIQSEDPYAAYGMKVQDRRTIEVRPAIERGATY